MEIDRDGGGLASFGALTLALGALWLVLTIVTGVSYLSAGVDGVKGAFQRADQVVFGAWLLALAWAATRPGSSDAGAVAGDAQGPEGGAQGPEGGG